MTRNRFQAILSFFHVNDNASRAPECTDRLFKIRPLLDLILERFRRSYTPDQKLSLDEGMLCWRGRLSFRVYNPMKPTKYGIKSYILACPKTGYCWNLKPYCGQSSTIPETVRTLLNRLTGHGHILYMDNFYNSVHLSKALLAEKTHVCGTLRNHRGEPAEFRNQQLKKGKIAALRQEDILLVAWKDKRIVKMVTTCHGNAVEPVQVRQKGTRERVRIHVFINV